MYNAYIKCNTKLDSSSVTIDGLDDIFTIVRIFRTAQPHLTLVQSTLNSVTRIM